MPIFKNGRVAGGIGVSGIPPEAAEYAAFAGSIPGHGLRAAAADPGVIFLDGIRLPFVKNMNRPVGETAGVVPGTGAFLVAPLASPLGPLACRPGICSAPTPAPS